MLERDDSWSQMEESEGCHVDAKMLQGRDRMIMDAQERYELSCQEDHERESDAR